MSDQHDQHDTHPKHDSFQALIDSITPEILANLKSAVETGRWPNGDRLTQQQVEHSLQAIIAYEARYVSEEQRTGYIDKTSCRSEPARDESGDARDSSRAGSLLQGDFLIASTKTHLH